MQELAPGVFVETDFRRITVGAILTSDGFVLIDVPPYPDEARYWRNTLRTIANRPILAIINTDGHPDRILGNCWYDAPLIVAHEDTITAIKSLPSAFVDNIVATLAYNLVERSTFAGAHVRTPSVGFTRRMQLRFGEHAIPLLAMPGPSDGSVWVHLPDQRILFAGDSVLADQHPFVNSTCTKSWLDNLTLLRRDRFPADRIIAGRGGLVDKSTTEPLSNYLRLARRRVQSIYRAGRPRADTTTLIPELLALFPYVESELESVQRRIKAGLDRIYEEFKNGDQEEMDAAHS